MAGLQCFGCGQEFGFFRREVSLIYTVFRGTRFLGKTYFNITGTELFRILVPRIQTSQHFRLTSVLP